MTEKIQPLYRFLILLSLLFTFTNCKRESINIGFSGNLSGNASSIGRDARNGIILAVDEINNSGGINGKIVNLVIKNDFGNPDSALKSANEYKEENVNYIVGHLLSSSFEKIFPRLDEFDLLYISPLISSTLYSDIDDNLIKVFPTTSNQSKVLAEIAVKNNHKVFYSIINLNNKKYSEDLSIFFAQYLSMYGGKVITTQFINGDKKITYSEIVDDIKRKNPDAVFVAGNGFDCAMLQQNCKKVNLDKIIYTGSWGSSEELLEFGGDAVNNKIITINYFDNNSTNQKYLSFEKTYKNRYHESPTFASIFSYDAAMILLTTLRKYKTPNVANIKNRIISQKYFEGLQSEIEIDQFGDSKRKPFLYTVSNNEFIKIQN